MTILKTAALAATVVGLSACAPMQTPEAGSGSPMGPPAVEVGQCMAQQYQSWIGRNRTELPAAPAGRTWRVTCTTCPVTMDYNPNRLNILYDQQSGIIREVRCG